MDPSKPSVSGHVKAASASDGPVVARPTIEGDTVFFSPGARPISLLHRHNQHAIWSSGGQRVYCGLKVHVVTSTGRPPLVAFAMAKFVESVSCASSGLFAVDHIVWHCPLMQCDVAHTLKDCRLACAGDPCVLYPAPCHAGPAWLPGAAALLARQHHTLRRPCHRPLPR